jgi:hypothetical protein
MADGIESYQDEISGALQILCSISCQDDAKQKTAKETLKRMSIRKFEVVKEHAMCFIVMATEVRRVLISPCLSMHSTCPILTGS